MKHCFLVLASALLLLTNCTRKKNLRELESGEKIAEYSRTCYNGVQDGDETFPDCGGSCAPCQEITPSCVATNNIIEMSATTTSTLAYSASVRTHSVSPDGKYTFSGTFSNGGNYTIILGTATPNVTTYYNVTSLSSPSSLNAADAIVDINPPASSGINLNQCTGGKVFISQASGIYSATICEASAYSTGWSTTGYAIKGKVAGQ